MTLSDQYFIFLKENDINLNIVSLSYGQSPFPPYEKKSFENYNKFINWCLEIRKKIGTPIALTVYITTIDTGSYYDLLHKPYDIGFTTKYRVEQFNRKIKL